MNETSIKTKPLPIDLNALFILVLLNHLMKLISDSLILIYQYFHFEVNSLFIVISSLLNLIVVFVCFKLYKQSELKKTNLIIPLITIVLTIYFMLFRNYDIAEFLNLDAKTFVHITLSKEATISATIANILVILIYCISIGQYVIFRKKKDFQTDEIGVEHKRIHKLLPIGLNSLFIFMLLYFLMRFTGEFQLFSFQLLHLEVNFLFIIISIILKLCVIYVCFRIYKQSQLKRSNLIIPLITATLIIYYMFFREYNLAYILDLDGAYFVKLVTSKELVISNYINSELIVLIYLLVFIQNVNFRNKSIDSECIK